LGLKILDIKYNSYYKSKAIFVIVLRIYVTTLYH